MIVLCNLQAALNCMKLLASSPDFVQQGGFKCILQVSDHDHADDPAYKLDPAIDLAFAFGSHFFYLVEPIKVAGTPSASRSW